MNQRFLRKTIISTFVGIIICLILLVQINPLAIFNGLKNIVPLFIVMYALLSIAVYLLRAWRFKILIGNDAQIRNLFPIVAVHTMFINLFPLGTGELAYPYLLKKKNITQGLAEGIPSLVLARLFDFMVVGVFFIIALLWLKKNIYGSYGVWIVLMSFFLLLILFRFVMSRSEYILSFLNSVKEKAWLKKYSKVTDKILKITNDLLTGFEIIKKQHILYMTLFATVLCRLVMYLAVVFLLHSVGIDLTFWEIVFLSSFYILLPLVPVNTIGGFGTTEALLVVLLMSFGYEKETAVIASFQIHLIQLSIAILLGLFGSLHLWLVRKKQAVVISGLG